MSELQTRNTSKNGAPAPARWRFAPNVDVYENADQFLIQLDVPGASAESVDVQVIGTTLHVRAEQANVESNPDAPLSIFERELELPAEVEPESAAAQLKDGVLEIRIDKGRAARRVKIPVGSN